MKKFKYIAVQLLFCCMVFSGCDKYLDVEPKGKQLLKTTNDYDLWLNSSTLTVEMDQTLLNYMTDNIDLVTVNNPPTGLGELVYTWAPQFTNDVTSPTYLWGDHYKRISLFNTVLSGIDAAEGGTVSQRNSIKAEALLGRANSYFYLVNEYAKPYDASTAATDLAVPFVTSDNVSQKAPGRSTVAEIYKHMIDDINEAIPNLPLDNGTARFRGTKAGAYSVLARIYLYRREYSEAQRYAEMALADTKAVMIDLTNSATFPTVTTMVSHPDGIYSRASNAAGMPISAELKSMFAVNDARRTVLYFNWASNVRGATSFYAAQVVQAFQLTNSGTTVQEMHLIAAECAARSTDPNAVVTALNHLNQVRRNRYTGAPIESRDFTSTSQPAVMAEVLAERRRELPFHSLRWFDLRRFDTENRTSTITRTTAQNVVVGTLEPHSPRYTLQIPIQVMAFNPDMIQNP
ncbi:RagB/SusD family nutrient uptake outer membrane protein [Pedobacter sp. MC2016-24]|uniref:RagB/SusD family nutrient uptake outer membrane protein n=1 Tax=Pedobacter sp. MC2016-24 TaxID=2780090 RepID=UPI001880E73A|nr:RagB/SusD family nutrient uptake outer membrane protein [Pedobacter sp. MC2016-24]MBE9602225.1 RagB/SusD family nutrient uptake outer membrane protein [Pedobacter sp. MC2016-24]